MNSVAAHRLAVLAERFARGALLAIVVLAVVNLGSVELLPVSFLAVALGCLTPLGALRQFGSTERGRIWAFSLACAGTLCAVAIIQSGYWVALPFEHPAWQSARDQIGAVAGAASVSPGQSIALLPALAPMLAFPLALGVARTDSDAFAMLRNLGRFSTAVAIFGLAQHTAFPSSLLFAKKEFYLDSLTAVFVNRNTAGTFLGVGTTIAVGFFLHRLRSLEPRRFVALLAGRGEIVTREEWRCLASGASALIQCLALLLTQSRGAVASSLIALLTLTVILAPRRSAAGRMPHRLVSRRRRFAQIAAFLLVGLPLLALLSARVIYRAGTTDDGARLCAFRSTMRIVVDAWPWGTGFGTFPDVFPAYRDAVCAGIAGTWQAAHSVYLEGAQSLGLAFCAVGAAGVCLLAMALMRGSRSRRRYRFAPATGVAILTLLGLHSLVDFSLQVAGVGVFSATALGCCAALGLGNDTARASAVESKAAAARTRVAADAS